MKLLHWIRWFKPKTGLIRIYVGPGSHLWLDLEIFCYGLDAMFFERWRIGLAVDYYGRSE